jgi:glycosyltransferase involved in cell wall biosynthesis
VTASGWRADRVGRSLETRLVRSAAAILGTFPSFGQLLEKGLGLPGLASRFHYIPNGFDPDDFAGIEARGTDAFTLTFAGSLYGTRTLSPLLRELGTLVREGEIPRERVRVRVLGTAPRLGAEIAEAGLEGRVDAPGPVPHREALASLLGSTMNVLVDIRYQGPNIHTPVKLFEYLRAGRPILALMQPGLIAEIIEEARGGYVVPPDGGAPLREVLRKAYRSWERGEPLPVPSAEVVSRYDRRRSTETVKRILEGLTRAPAPPGEAVLRAPA